MKKLVSGLFFILIGHFSLSQTQSDMNKTEYKTFLQADKELNQVYQTIVSDYKKDPAFLKSLKVSQRIWVQFRDAELKMMYPDREAGYYGSTYPVCWSVYKTELTRQRIEKLRKWLVGRKEGDACSPSIQIRQ